MFNEATNGCYHTSRPFNDEPTCGGCEGVFAVAYIVFWGWMIWCFAT
jgi:hypothetical protein